MPKRRSATKCCYREGARRCPMAGEGNPPLCDAHRIAVVEASRPKRPTEVLASAIANFLAGKPINVDATIGAADTLLGAWAMGGGMGGGYHPDNQAPRGPWQPGGFPWQQPPRAPRPRPPPPPDPELDRRRAIAAARQVLGFASTEPLTAEVIKDRKRRLAKRYHPDLKGGSVQKMALVNDAADVLLAAL